MIALAVALVMSACTRATPEQQVVNDAVTALGGIDRVQAVRSVVLTGSGKQYNLGQDVTPTAHGQTFNVSRYRRAIDVANNRARTEVTRTPEFRYFQGQGETRQVNGIDGEVAYNVAANGNATRAGGTASADRRIELLHHPITVVRAALDPMAMLSNARTEGSESLVDITTASGQKVTLAIDTGTKLPTRVTNLGSNNVLGDVVLSTRFADYADVQGIQLPSRITTATDDFVTAEFTVTSEIDGDAGDAAAPEAAASAQPPGAPAAPNVAVTEMARGIWFLGGGTHNSLLVEFNDHLTLIEVPQSEARALAVIGKARELVPGKPLTQVITSHHHFDHTGGVRGAISEGLTILTHPDTAAMLEQVATRPRTVTPDALANNPKPLNVEPVSADRVLTDGTMTVNLYVFSDEHAQNNVYAYFPRERILWQSDVYNQGFAVHPYATNFNDELKRRGLRVDRIAPGHGQIATWAQFQQDVAAQQPAATATN
jgi:hypothetical protein